MQLTISEFAMLIDTLQSSLRFADPRGSVFGYTHEGRQRLLVKLSAFAQEKPAVEIKVLEDVPGAGKQCP
jgi:hypothetical protein